MTIELVCQLASYEYWGGQVGAENGTIPRPMIGTFETKSDKK
jgi:hypothetical protein